MIIFCKTYNNVIRVKRELGEYYTGSSYYDSSWHVHALNSRNSESTQDYCTVHETITFEKGKVIATFEIGINCPDVRHNIHWQMRDIFVLPKINVRKLLQKDLKAIVANCTIIMSVFNSAQNIMRHIACAT